MREAVIVAACRTAVGKANRGSLVHVRPDDMGAAVLRGVIERAGIEPELVEDVVMGCAMPEAEQGMNIARMCVHAADLPESIGAQTVNRYCASGLQTVWDVNCNIAMGSYDCGIGGGTETMSMIPMGGNKIVPNIKLAETYPQAYVGMGQTAENVAIKYGVTREEQDAFALESNRRAVAANKNGAFKEQIVPLKAYKYNGAGNKLEFVYDVDEGPRESTMEALGGLKPAFMNPKANIEGAGTVTAGNASQMSDGAAAVLLMEKGLAAKKGLKPLAAIRGFATAAFDPNLMGIGPALAIPKLMERFGKPLGLSLADIDCFELNEAFASQAVYCVKELALDVAKVNPNGGAIALGHPLGCTGAKLTTQLVYWMRDNKKKWGIVSMCIGGGMGAAGLFENLSL